MATTSKSSRQKSNNFKFVPESKQQWHPERNWLELPSDIMANILYRVGVVDILENAQKVCTTWHKICKDPSLWRVIYMVKIFNEDATPLRQKMCKHAVDRSQGQLVDITIVDFGTHELLQYIADRSCQLKRLTLACCYRIVRFTETLEKLVLLDELSILITLISKEDIEGIGRCCPMLKTLKVNHTTWFFLNDSNERLRFDNEMAIAIGENLHELRHLEIIGSDVSNIGLEAILNGCPHLQLLDLRQCSNIDLKGDMGKRCSQLIKSLKLPSDSIEDFLSVVGELLELGC